MIHRHQNTEPYVDLDAPGAEAPRTRGLFRSSLERSELRPRLEQTSLNGARPAKGGAGVDYRRRVLNLAVASVGILLLSPAMLLIAIAIKLTSRGPILYRQERVGLDRRAPRHGGPANGRRHRDMGGRVFTIYKFRTMTVRKEEEEEDQVWATPDDPRVTPVGRVLRRYRLDEIPQLFNVLMGDMNVVGPRPEQPEIFEQLRPEVDRFAERQRVLPGITGWAQINRGYDQCLDDVRRKVGLDLEYIRHRSAAEDLRIMVRTLPVMVKKKGGH